MFQFAGFASPRHGFTWRYPKRGGLPHSEIPGSTVARTSPGLFAACHVLHRLSVPRHPPDALTSLAPLQEIAPGAGTHPGTCTHVPAPAYPVHTHAPAPSPTGEGTRMRKTSSSSRCRKNRRTRSLRAARPTPHRGARRRMVGLGRFERPTSRLSGVRSDRLSYRPGTDDPPTTADLPEGMWRRRSVRRTGSRSGPALERR